MKHNIYTLLLMVCFVSCQKDLLKTVPNDRITSAIFWNTEKDAVLAVNAMYNYLDGTTIFSWDAISDIASANVNYLEESYIERGIYDGLTPRVEQKWGNAYKGIRAVNYFLENIDRVQTANTTRIDQLKGEARFIRAYLYSQLLTLYGDVPLIVKSISIEEAKTLTRASAAQVWDFVSDELEAAAADLPEEWSEKGRITKGAALGFKARSMLYAKRYQDAADAAKAVMDLNIYHIYPSYKDLFAYAAENNSEVILNKEFIKDIFPNSAFSTLAPYSQSGGSFVPLQKIVDAYEMTNGKQIGESGSGFDPYDPYTNRDPRLHYSVYVLGSALPNGTTYDSRPNSGTNDAVGYKPGSTKTGFNIKKYVNTEDYSNPANGGINIILLRYAEVLLIYAEARIELNQIDPSVYNAINEVRQRPDVNQPAISGPRSQEEMRDIVRHERMVELAFEGLRFFDIRRWGIAGEVMNEPIFGMTYTDENGHLTTIQDESTVRYFDPQRDYLWPIPKKELDLNKNLTQNPNW